MKKSLLLITLSALLFITGCSTTSVPSTPKPHPEKYTLQILLIEVPVDEDTIKSFDAECNARSKNLVPLPTFKTLKAVPTTQAGDTEDSLLNRPKIFNKNVEELLNDPNATITELPVVYAAIGETAINDQTKTISAPKNYELKTNTTGVISVVYDNGTAKVGKYVEITLQKVEDGEATCDLWFFDKSLAGSFKYEVAPATKSQDAVTAFMPKFKALEMKTQVALIPGNLISMGGLIGTTIHNMNTEEETKTAVEKYTFIRILPPQK